MHFMTHRTARLRADERHSRFALPWNLNNLLIGEKVTGSRPEHILMQPPCSITRSHKVHRLCGQKPQKRSVSFPWLHSRPAGRMLHIQLSDRWTTG